MIKINILRCKAAVVDEALPLSNKSKLPLPGHSEGMTAIKVKHDDQYVILAGDSGN